MVMAGIGNCHLYSQNKESQCLCLCCDTNTALCAKGSAEMR